MNAPIRRGELYWIASSSMAHPHVVVQDDVFNDSRVPTVIVCSLSSQLHKASEPGNVLLDPGEGDLPQQSVVVVSQIDAVPKSQLGDRIGALSQARVDQILDGLRFQQRSFTR
ncbi:MAG TPA: type II toxin-antitoxin system PemK/MazF family toxin [Kofleriaceae bacterium]|nr:type II toxin-antitoxin system PemK/MazF family toxin [Kofleriaceae bacterium]